MVPSLTANCNSTLSNHTVGSLRSALATVDWIFCWNNSAQSANRVKVEGQGASEQFKEGGKTHETKSSTTTTTTITFSFTVFHSRRIKEIRVATKSCVIRARVSKAFCNSMNFHGSFHLNETAKLLKKMGMLAAETLIEKGTNAMSNFFNKKLTTRRMKLQFKRI